MDEIKKIQEILNKYFGNEKVKFFQSSDAFSRIAGDTFITYYYNRNCKDSVVLAIGGSHIDETPIRVCNTAEELENLIKAIIL